MLKRYKFDLFHQTSSQTEVPVKNEDVPAPNPKAAQKFVLVHNQAEAAFGFMLEKKFLSGKFNISLRSR